MDDGNESGFSRSLVVVPALSAVAVPVIAASQSVGAFLLLSWNLDQGRIKVDLPARALRSKRDRPVHDPYLSMAPQPRLPTTEDIARSHSKMPSTAANVDEAPDAPLTREALPAAIQPLRDDLDNLKREVDELRHRCASMHGFMKGMTPVLMDVVQTSAQAYNMGCMSGEIIPFVPVPCHQPDNTWVLPEMIGLPSLTNVQAISDLSDKELRDYMKLYDITDRVEDPRWLKLAKLRTYIGCREPISSR
ncbi:hypothetical protein JVT61DRAFT_10075 [Boletus reticuloceps]|uniref:Mug135-like C-terminal domain-containing protein n=1 Tax=Boletus reticuloceps TaxID=495285 RepID=A0A8I2YW66_9AGAM|nr:hypothetical protein JVT61DRAFT_10075 [Boletus reticuloceps]